MTLPPEAVAWARSEAEFASRAAALNPYKNPQLAAIRHILYTVFVDERDAETTLEACIDTASRQIMIALNLDEVATPDPVADFQARSSYTIVSP